MRWKKGQLELVFIVNLYSILTFKCLVALFGWEKLVLTACCIPFCLIAMCAHCRLLQALSCAMTMSTPFKIFRHVLALILAFDLTSDTFEPFIVFLKWFAFFSVLLVVVGGVVVVVFYFFFLIFYFNFILFIYGSSKGLFENWNVYTV